MKFLKRASVDHKGNFLEFRLENKNLIYTGNVINPEKLIHFGTDLVDMENIFLPNKGYIISMEKIGVDYLYISEMKEVDFAQSPRPLANITAYLYKV